MLGILSIVLIVNLIDSRSSTFYLSCISFKERFDKNTIDSAFFENQGNFEIHLIYAGHYYLDAREDKLKSFIWELMVKYKIQKVMITMVEMQREQLITKEMAERYCSKPLLIPILKPMFKPMKSINRSINEDIELFFENLQLRRVLKLLLDIGRHKPSK